MGSRKMAAYEVYKLHFIMNLLSVLGQMQLEVKPKLMLMLPRNAAWQHAGSAQDEVLAVGPPAGPQTHTKDAKHAANAERKNIALTGITCKKYIKVLGWMPNIFCPF